MARIRYSTLGIVMLIGGVASADVLCIRAGGRTRTIKIREGAACRPTEVSIGKFDGTTMTFGVAVKVESADLTVDGGNVNVRNGTGATDGPVNGKGNVVIGYDEGSGGEDRSGSHNLVLGSYNAYSSTGGIVSGSLNAITGSDAAVIASVGSTASGGGALVAGGQSSSATGPFSAVVGGFSNAATAPATTVLGGEGNEASVNLATAAGGIQNRAATFLSTTVGGACNTAGATVDPSCVTPACVDGCFTTVTGGFGNSATGSYSAVGGGLSRSATGTYDWAAGSLLEDF